jgi:hypothetical protein
MLPHEAEVSVEITNTYSAQLHRMTTLHDAVMGMLTAGSWSITKPKGINRFTAETMAGLLTKACKTFRAIHILTERGLHGDANALARVLMETAVAILFILQKESEKRAMIYHAYGLVQDLKMLNDWKATPGLRRKATKKMFQQANKGLATYLSRLPTGTNVKSQWSGKSNLRDALKALCGDVMYATLYRFTSAITHGSDFGAHFEVDAASGDLVWEIEPTVRGFEAPTYAARELLWMAAHRIDERLGLGFDVALATHKLTPAEVKAGLS